MHPTLLQDLAIILAVAGAVTLIFHLIKQPVVLGYILAGLIVGKKMSFPLVHDERTVEMLAELGVILLMFGLGLHFSLKKLFSVGATAVIAAMLKIGVMLLAGYATGRAFGWSPMDSIFLGAILSISSTTIIIKVFQEMKLTKAPFAHMVFGILIVEDILAIAIIALLSGLGATGSFNLGEILVTLGKLGVFLAMVLVVGLLLVPMLIRFVDRFKSNEMLLIVALALCFMVSLIALKLGYSVALGAFVMGSVIAETREHAKVEHLLEPVRDVFAAVFFVAVGMMIDPQILWQHTWPILGVTVVALVAKVVSFWMGTFLAGNDRRTSLRVAMSLAPIGEFSFIIAQLGMTLKVNGKPVTSEFLYPMTIALSAITTLLTPYLIKAAGPLSELSETLGPRRWLNYADLYTKWVGRLGRPSGATPQIRRLFIRWSLQLSLNFVLLTGIFIATAWAGRRPEVRQLEVPPWTGGPNAIVWFVGVLVALPLLVATLRKLRAVAIALAELSVSRSAGGERTDAIRRVIANSILSVGIFALVLWGLGITSAILPPWPVLLTLALLVAGIAFLMWKSLIRIYAKAQIRLVETLADNKLEAGESPAPVFEGPLAFPILAGAQLQALTVTPGSPADRKLIRELSIRTATGASVVAIDRHGEQIVNPGPDEELRAEDQVYLLGTAEQIATAVKALGGDHSPPPPLPLPPKTSR